MMERVLAPGGRRAILCPFWGNSNFILAALIHVPLPMTEPITEENT